MPCSRTVAARSSQSSRGGMFGDVEHSARRSMRPGACAAFHIPSIPPMDRPQ